MNTGKRQPGTVVDAHRNGGSNKKIFLIVKAVVTVSLIYWLLSKVDGETIGRILAQSNYSLMLLAMAALSAAFAVGCVRWWMLLGHLGVHISLRHALYSYYLGIFFNNFLPTGVGGDVARTVHLSMKGHGAKPLISSALVDRVMGLVVMLLMAAASIMLSPELHMAAGNKIYLVVLIFLIVLGGALLFGYSDKLRAPIAKLHRRYQHTRMRKAAIEVIQLCFSYRTAVGVVLKAVLLSIIMQSFVIMTYFLLGNSIGITLSLTTYFAFASIVQLASSMPISIGGLGIREGTMVALLTSVNIDIHLAAALSVLFLSILWICSLPGVVVLFLGKLPRQHANA